MLRLRPYCIICNECPHADGMSVRGIGVDSGEGFRIIERDKFVAPQRGLANSGSYHSTLKLVGDSRRNTESIVCRI